jgi:Zn-dependent metalloprotease
VVASRADDLGVTGVLVPLGTTTSAAGGHVVRLQQRVAGAPVLGGEVVVDLDAAGRTRSIISETLPGAAPAVTTAAVSADQARGTALDVVAKASGLPSSALVADDAPTWVYDPRIFGAPGAPRAVLVRRVAVSSPVDVGVRHEVLVDAVTGKVIADIDQIHSAATQRVCDAASSSGKVPCLLGDAVANPRQAPATSKRLRLRGEDLRLLQRRLDRDSIDNAGMTLISTVNYCPRNSSNTGDVRPYENAFASRSATSSGSTSTSPTASAPTLPASTGSWVRTSRSARSAT